jgi:hypothetical protein
MQDVYLKIFYVCSYNCNCKTLIYIETSYGKGTGSSCTNKVQKYDLGKYDKYNYIT